MENTFETIFKNETIYQKYGTFKGEFKVWFPSIRRSSRINKISKIFNI